MSVQGPCSPFFLYCYSGAKPGLSITEKFRECSAMTCRAAPKSISLGIILLYCCLFPGGDVVGEISNTKAALADCPADDVFSRQDTAGLENRVIRNRSCRVKAAVRAGLGGYLLKSVFTQLFSVKFDHCFTSIEQSDSLLFSALMSASEIFGQYQIGIWRGAPAGNPTE